MAKETGNLIAEQEQRLQGAVQTEGITGLTLLIRIKTVALLVIGLWVLSFPVPWLTRLYYESLLVVCLGDRGPTSPRGPKPACGSAASPPVLRLA